MNNLLKKSIKKTLLYSIVSFTLIAPNIYQVAQAQEGDVLETQYVSDEKVVIWEGDPLHIEVPMGKERRIDFPEPIVEFNIKPEHSNLIEMMLTPSGSLFWKPKAPFDSIRTRAISMTGAHYIVDFSSQDDENYGSLRAIRILDPVTGGMEGSQKPSTNSQHNQTITEKPLPLEIPDFLVKSQRSNTPDFVQMSRYAMSHYTGSARLIPKMTATVVNAPNPPRNWIRVFGDRINTKTLRSWKSGKFYITAIMLRNISPMALEFDPRALRGSFVYSAMMNPLLQSRGNVGDEALLVVISDQPFQDAVLD